MWFQYWYLLAMLLCLYINVHTICYLGKIKFRMIISIYVCVDYQFIFDLSQNISLSIIMCVLAFHKFTSILCNLCRMSSWWIFFKCQKPCTLGKKVPGHFFKIHILLEVQVYLMLKAMCMLRYLSKKLGSYYDCTVKECNFRCK